ncbi:hypothetical protein STRCR_1925 [Streptococcus criceti HS-6]|uniref:Uncharacterized protein n=1 Tax=Streptococcus criceti HS-6 TaxID=873449 RepID=G5JR40_STRCG|nr:hypothetical protein STRCR_1925 [Streptococcus criceti HS-6]
MVLSLLVKLIRSHNIFLKKLLEKVHHFIRGLASLLLIILI